MSQPEPDAATPRGTLARPRSARRQFAATILVLEAFVVLFAALVAYGLRAAPGGTIGLLGGALALSLVLTAGILRFPAGYVVGSVLQLALLAAGLVVPMMAVIGVIFVALWVVALRLGARIDRERWQRYDAAVAAEGGGA